MIIMCIYKSCLSKEFRTALESCSQGARMHFSILASVLTFLLTGCEGSPIQNDTSTLNAPNEICMEELGCFTITDDFKSYLNRPINVLPSDRAKINTQFYLYTRRNAKESQILNASEEETFKNSNLDPKDPVKFIVPGFLDSLVVWMLELKDEFLIHGDYNIIIVDWMGGNIPPYYQATANTRVVGAEIAFFIKALETYTGAEREKMHIMGHSLGSHAAGYAGEILKTLGRITGLDPAGPYFNNMPPSVRLDPTDAYFVDAIHSDATGYGTRQEVGHIDFYPNNGQLQPGCETEMFTGISTGGVVEGTRRLFSCNHQRAIDFFYYTINYRKVTPVGYECTDWKDFLDGMCSECGTETERCAIMGIRANEYYQNRNSSVQHAMYLKTDRKRPFFLYHYQVNIQLYKPETPHNDVTGTIEVKLSGSKAAELANVQTRPRDLHMGTGYQYLVTTVSELGEIMNVSLKWYSASLNPVELVRKPNLYVDYISVIPMNAIEKSPRNMKNRVFCEKPEEGINSGTTATFKRDNECLKRL